MLALPNGRSSAEYIQTPILGRLSEAGIRRSPAVVRSTDKGVAGENAGMVARRGPDLLQAIDRRYVDREAVVDALNSDWLPPVVTRYNSEFGVRYFGRPPEEPIPVEKRLLTTFRTRLGSLLEYGLGVTLDSMLEDEYGSDLRLSFVVAHEYPDFFMRGADAGVLLRIDCKLLHDESAEYSARFELPRSEIDPDSDFLLYGAWQWRATRYNDLVVVYPHVLELLFVPADDIAAERDHRLEHQGGRLDEDGIPWLLGGARDTNYGKINRIVDGSRRHARDLPPSVAEFLAFTARHAAAVERAAKEAPAGDPAAIAEPTPDELNPVDP